MPKLRGVKFREGYHDYVIVTGGLRVFPRLVAAEHHVEFRRESVASGLKELDQPLGGGLDRGTTTLLLGPAGSGQVYFRIAIRLSDSTNAFTLNIPIVPIRQTAFPAAGATTAATLETHSSGDELPSLSGVRVLPLTTKSIRET